MTFYPAKRPVPRLSGLQDCLSHSRRERGPGWPLFWRTCAMGLVAFGVGLLLAAAIFTLR